MKNLNLYLFNITFILSYRVLAIPFNLDIGPSLMLYNSSVPVQNRGIHCFRQIPYDPSPTKDDCVKAIDKMLVDPDLSKVKTWQVPRSHAATKAWIHGTCSVDVGVWAPATPPVGATDRFTTWSCVAKAQAIVQKCLGEQSVGGRSEIGPKRIFQLTVTHPRQVP
jgi:hypothetical protein